MKLGIMQPYFFPYIGYFQLINAVDKFVIYDNIKYTKKGWINRNRYLLNGRDELMTLPLKKGADELNVCDRFLSDDFEKEALKILRKIEAAYNKAPYFHKAHTLLQQSLMYSDKNLFNFLFNSIKIILDYLELDTELIVSSSISGTEELKGQDKVLYICEHLKANEYINAIGGLELYDKNVFELHDIKLSFIKTDNITYRQFGSTFVPNLSILDVMMFNSPQDIKVLLERHRLV